jgi:mannose-6-phosphate isomerase
MTPPGKPIRLEPHFVERVWGTTDLAPWFPPQAAKTGEVWFSSDHNRTSLGATLRECAERFGPRLLGTRVQPAFGGRFPLLVKFIFTAERLSVQVHPDDRYARTHENSPGKNEMWHVLRASPGATLALGFREPVSVEELRASALDGTIEQRLALLPARPGDTFLVPAGTVHAIGAGIALAEVQQNSDVTYRIYDYGRPRELHLERALEVADRGPHPGLCPGRPGPSGVAVLAASPHFVTESLSLSVPTAYQPDPERFHLLIVIEGRGRMGEDEYSQGQVWLIPGDAPAFTLEPFCASRMLRTYVPDHGTD